MIGLSRSDAGEQAADGVIHTAFNHDFSNLKQTSEDDRKAIETLGEVLAGSDRQMSRRRRLIFSKRDFEFLKMTTTAPRQGQCLERELLRNKEKLCQ
jgi:hypothetical protein